MRIGLVCPYNIFKGGGVQEVVFALQKGLAKKGHNVSIISPSPRNHGQKTPAGVILIGKASVVKSFHTTSQISASITPEEVDQLLENENFDILHFHEPWVPMLSQQILSRSKAINVATFHAKLPDTIMARTIEKVVTPYTRAVLKYLDSLTAVSAAAAQYVKTLTNQAITIVPNGIDLGKYQVTSIKKQNSNKTILFVGRLEKRKGLKYLIKAFAKLTAEHPDVRLVIAGDGPDRFKLENYVQAHGIKNVEFLGFIKESKKLKLLQQADLFCSPARYGESFGIVLLEAMASGCVVVAGDNPGYSSVLNGTGQISLVEPKHTKDFVKKLELLLYDQKLRQLWQEWAAGEVKKYNYDKVVDQYEKVYLDSLTQKRK